MLSIVPSVKFNAPETSSFQFRLSAKIFAGNRKTLDKSNMNLALNRETKITQLNIFEV